MGREWSSENIFTAYLAALGVAAALRIVVNIQTVGSYTIIQYIRFDYERFFL